MTIVHFITHPEVVIDPTIPVPDWPLSPVGIRRMQAAICVHGGHRALGVKQQRKEGNGFGRNLTKHLGLIPIVVDALGENNRSADRLFAEDEFEAVANEFFARA